MLSARRAWRRRRVGETSAAPVRVDPGGRTGSGLAGARCIMVSLPPTPPIPPLAATRARRCIADSV
ncbi:hypothetical protein rosag_24030 [Roseisolibacter agri]|uniref:Uncharacterized protein n=1 Tax=Roseisolibacter agri TaxID=2014610 RepID=A0AA37QGB9_9BACT|nr:hypothetical protein rosag_24030 [Roseisolibacter agri]